MSRSLRVVATMLLCAAISPAQFKSTVPLVLAPATVTDSKGRFVDGLTEDDLILYDNNVPQATQIDWTTYPIDLVIAVQTSANSGAVIDKLGAAGILLTQVLAGDAGQTVVLTFSDTVRKHLDFTGDADAVTNALRMLRMEGESATTLDAVLEALRMLEARPAARRRVIFAIAEKRDRGSAAKLADVVERAQRLNVVVYWVAWSPFLQPFTVKPPTAEDRKPIAKRIKVPACAACPAPDDTGVPRDYGPGGLNYALGELIHRGQPDLFTLFTDLTGGRALSFLRKNALEQAIQLVGEEVHRQYLLSFQPKAGESAGFHTLRAAVKNRPDLTVKTRAGYWALP